MNFLSPALLRRLGFRNRESPRPWTFQHRHPTELRWLDHGCHLVQAINFWLHIHQATLLWALPYPHPPMASDTFGCKWIHLHSEFLVSDLWDCWVGLKLHPWAWLPWGVLTTKFPTSTSMPQSLGDCSKLSLSVWACLSPAGSSQDVLLHLFQAAICIWHSRKGNQGLCQRS